MSQNCLRHRLALIALAAAAGILSNARPAQATQFPVLNPAYTQEIYTGPLIGGPGMAWTTSLNLLTRNGSNILEYSPTQNAVHQGTNIHGTIITHAVAGLSSSGYGMTNGTDGYIYAVTGTGLQRFDPANWAAPAQSLAGTVGGQGYGINTLPDGRIVYSDGINNSKVWVYNPVTSSNTLIYSAAFLIDDIETGPGGQIAIAGQSNSSIVILTSAGAVINSFATPHYPDGLAFGAGPFPNSLYSNNNDGTISRYDLAAGYTGAPAITDIATGAGSYGDLAAVGPDCAFYITAFENGSLHGATPGVGTNWDNSVTNAEPSITRIALKDRPGAPEQCGFYSLLETVLPEPGSASVLSAAAAATLLRRQRRR